MTQDSKSSSTEPGHSAPSSGSVASLADRLKAKTAQEASAIQRVTQIELDLHQQNLRDMSALVLGTTKDVIETQVSEITSLLSAPSSAINKALSNSGQQLTDQALKITTTLDASAETLNQTLGGAQKSLNEASSKVKASANKTAQAIAEQQSEMRSEMVKQQRFLFWMMKLPLLGVLFFCLLVCGGTWAWTEYRINQASVREQQADQRLAERQSQINQLTAEFCATPAGRRNCRQ